MLDESIPDNKRQPSDQCRGFNRKGRKVQRFGEKQPFVAQ
jgi:hypothetical protein